MSPRSILVLLATASLAGCRTEAVPARVVDGTPEGRTELRAVVADALNRSDVPLADDAFHGEPTIVVERVRHVDAEGRRVMGREIQPPDHFRLLRFEDACWLEHVETERRWRLEHVRCEAAPPIP